MMVEAKTVKIFTMLQEFPCGPQACCCGPIGQTEEETQTLKKVLEEKLKINVEIYDVKDGQAMKDHRNILTLLRSFGWMILPIITVDSEPVSMGMPEIDKAIDLIRTKLKS